MHRVGLMGSSSWTAEHVYHKSSVGATLKNWEQPAEDKATVMCTVSLSLVGQLLLTISLTKSISKASVEHAQCLR